MDKDKDNDQIEARLPLTKHEEFYVKPDAIFDNYNLMGGIKKLTKFDSRGNIEMFYSPNGYWEEIRYYNLSGELHKKEIFKKSEMGVPEMEIEHRYDYNSGELTSTDTNYYRVDVLNRTITYELFTLMITGYYDSYGNEVNSEIEGYGYFLSDYDEYGKVTSTESYPKGVLSDKTVFHYDDNNDPSFRLRVLYNGLPVNDTLNYFKYMSYDSKNNWTEAKEYVRGDTTINGVDSHFFRERTHKRAHAYY